MRPPSFNTELRNFKEAGQKTKGSPSFCFWVLTLAAAVVAAATATAVAVATTVAVTSAVTSTVAAAVAVATVAECSAY